MTLVVGAKKNEMKQRRIYRLKVTLIDIEPSIWREIEVPDDFSLGDLHSVD